MTFFLPDKEDMGIFCKLLLPGSKVRSHTNFRSDVAVADQVFITDKVVGVVPDDVHGIFYTINCTIYSMSGFNT